MYKYIWDEETGGLLLTSDLEKFSKEPRPVYYKELDILGFDQYWNYPKDDSAPLLWAEANNYIYKGRTVARTKGGSLYTKPELILLEEPEPNGESLQLVDVSTMCQKNGALMETLEQETIQKIYNTYRKYKDKVDLFYVAFSGGKDSVVALDLVQRALPHDDFKVVFGNTDMELPSTLNLIEELRKYCKYADIDFQEAKAPFSAFESWKKFGPPARKVRWCCTVHKTAPVINKLCEVYGYDKLRSVMITGVRGDESASRSEYDELSFSKKIFGQYSFHPLLTWSSAEVFLYIYINKLLFNEAYKIGFNRVGCIMCPNSTGKYEFIKEQVFPKQVNEYCKIILNTSQKELSGNNGIIFLEDGGWKARLSGKVLNCAPMEKVSFEEKKTSLEFSVYGLKDQWKIWYKTVGSIDGEHPNYILEYNGIFRKCKLIKNKEITTFVIENNFRNKNSIEFVYFFKRVLYKTQYCIYCKACMAECSRRCIKMENNKVEIDDSCIKCHSCLKIPNGCLYYNSVRGSVTMNSLKGINRYLSVGVDYNWIIKYCKDQSFEPGNRKTDVMFSFLSDAGMVKKKKITPFGEKMINIGIDTVEAWGIMLCNLSYTPAFRWYINNIPFNSRYTNEELILSMEGATKKAPGEFWNGFKVILDTNYWFQSIGFGIPEITVKTLKNGSVQKKLHSIKRESWENPVPEVILYALYKFAEACDGYYQFSMATLFDDSIEREGVSPTRIFGLDHDTMTRILNGLSINYPAFISVSFTLDLDNITLREDKTSEDVLSLF